MGPLKQFVRLTPTHPLVEELKSGKHEWWNTLAKRSRKDPDLNIQVRGHYLSVYSRMGSLLKIEYKNGKVVCSLHYKYLIADRRSKYVDVKPSDDNKDLAVSLESCKLVTSILDEENFRRIKSNIAALAGEEKKIQSRLVEKNRDTLLDAEIAFSKSGVLIDVPEDESAAASVDSGNTRIDLVNYDKNCKRLVFIELKQIFDDRLYTDSKGFKEVNAQISKYTAFAQSHSAELIKTYKDVVEVKRVLGLLPDGSVLNSAKIEQVEPKPILAIAAYNQDIIDAMKERVKDHLLTEGLAALYFFGSSVDVNLTTRGGNKEVFI